MSGTQQLRDWHRCIAINDRSPELRLLYVSSSVRQALLYEPEDILGHSSYEFLANENDEEEAEKHHGGQIEDNVIMTNVFIKNKAGRTVFERSIAFVCGNVTFHVLTIYPNITPDRLGGDRAIDIQRFKCILNENTDDSEMRQLDTSAMYSMRTHYQACFVLDDADADMDTGPKIVFTTDSISRILDVDSSDLYEAPFLSLVAIQDNQAACEFLERAMSSNDLVVERLHLLVNPLEGNLLGDRRTVSVEFMAMGSDGGAIMLCQLERPNIPGHHDGRYIPLEYIISSDPETSDFPDAWSRMEL